MSSGSITRWPWWPIIIGTPGRLDALKKPGKVARNDGDALKVIAADGKRVPEKVTLHNHLIGGGFGRRLYTDYVVQAAALAKQVKWPLKVVWSREEDIQHDRVRGLYAHSVSASLDDIFSYDIPNMRTEYTREDGPVPSGFWRGVGPTRNMAVLESFIDELAEKAGQDPLA
ncbi:MAG: molybdopterin cofactor-binding domain-containing protein [Duganella sp.]